MTLKFYFGTNQNGGSDGITITYHNIRPYKTLIGSSGGFLGYGFDTNSNSLMNSGPLPATQIFGSRSIEFDVYSSIADSYDNCANCCGMTEHISYLTNATMISDSTNSVKIKEN